MEKLSMLDMNSLNAIAVGIRGLKGFQGASDNLLAIQAKATAMLKEQQDSKIRSTMYKTVNVTNPRNVLVQIPAFIAGVEWGLKQGDSLEVLYSDETKEITIRPVVLGRGDFVNKG